MGKSSRSSSRRYVAALKLHYSNGKSLPALPFCGAHILNGSSAPGRIHKLSGQNPSPGRTAVFLSSQDEGLQRGLASLSLAPEMNSLLAAAKNPLNCVPSSLDPESPELAGTALTWRREKAAKGDERSITRVHSPPQNGSWMRKT